MIRAENLTVFYGRTRALDAIDLEVGEGIFGLFGANGSGKSTLLRVTAGLLHPTSGRVTVNGHSPRTRSEAVRRAVGYVGHEAGLYPHLTVAENLGLFAQLHGASGSRVNEMLEAVGLGDRGGTLAADLSAGFKRRASVARALIHEPAILLLDEPFANLDDDASALVSEAVRAWRAPGRVCIIATHGAKIVKAFADGGVILKRGRVVTSGRYQRAETSNAI
jgi:heme ABC exporter ATP-binding subunit CcmA